MKKGQQFKIETIEELEACFENLSPWYWDIGLEKTGFDYGDRWVVKDEDGDVLLMTNPVDGYETIENPFKKSIIMKKGQQFRVDSLEELKEAYENLKDRWHKGFSIRHEMGDFKDKNYRYIVCDNKIYINEIYLTEYLEDYETIPNPFKKEKPEPFSTSINNIIKAAESAETFIKLVDIVKERDELRKELNELRREVEALKEMAQPISIIDLGKIEKELKEKELNNKKEELKINHPSCQLTLMDNGLYNSIIIKIGNKKKDFCFLADKDEAIKIVNYLKKHFEI